MSKFENFIRHKGEINIQTTKTMRSAEVNLISEWYKNIDEQNFDAIRNLMADDHKFFNPMTPEAIDAEQHVGLIQMMTKALKGTHHADIVIEEKGWVAVHGHWKGIHIGEFEGIPATGRVVRFTWSDMFQIVDGKVVNEHLEMNPASILQQLQSIPELVG